MIRKRVGVRDLSCVFCRIVARESPADVLYEDEFVVAFRDVKPAAPVHILVVPKAHVPRVDAPEVCDLKLGHHILCAIASIARQEGLQEGGFRVVSNAGRDGGQTVDHLHFHILAGRRLAWPPG